MSKLENRKRIQILKSLTRGSSMKAASDISEVGFNSVRDLLIEAGETAKELHDKLVRNVPACRVQADEMLAYLYVKEKNVRKAKAAPEGAGDFWTWTVLDADSRLLIHWQFTGSRDTTQAAKLMRGLKARLDGRPVQITTDGLRSYQYGVEMAFRCQYPGTLSQNNHEH